MRPLQFMMASPTSRGSSQVEIQACNSAIGELWFNPCAFSSNPKAALFGRAAWVSIARMKRSRLLLPALVLAGCATAPTVGADRQVEVDSHLLLGDIALERQDGNTAAREFLAAAMLSDEPGPAERATRIAHELDLTEQGLTAGARWRELAPDDDRPAYYLGVFETRANRVQRAIAEFETFIRSIDDVGTGFVLVSSFSITVALGQAYLPKSLGMAAGLIVGLAIGTGGIGVTILGWVADHWGVFRALHLVAALPVAGLVAALCLPEPRH